MLALKQLKKDPQGVAKALARRGYTLPANISDHLVHQPSIMVNLQALLQQRNETSAKIGELVRVGTPESKKQIAALKESITWMKSQISYLSNSMEAIDSDLYALLAIVPNIPADDVPVGKGEEDNQVIEKWIPHSTVLCEKPTNHADIGPGMGMDFDAGAALSGSRFTVLRKQMATLHRALGQFMLDCHVNQGYEECYVPYLVNDTALFGTGQLPKFEDDMYGVGENQYLIPTGEVPLTNLVAGKLLSSSDLPMKLTSLTPCFRSEAGSAGRDVRGLIRQHQFDKVELVRVTTKEESRNAHLEMLEDVRRVLQALRLPYRIMLLCGGDMGFSAQKTYDFEVWMPSQNTWREISSVSNCGDFQARRMKARVKTPTGNELVHTLNGSGVAVGRALAAIVENHTVEGELFVPGVLKDYIPQASRNIFKFI